MLIRKLKFNFCFNLFIISNCRYLFILNKTTLLNNPGNAPTFKSDGTPVEIHHQGSEGPYKEMHWEDHREKGNFNKNHLQGKHQPLTKAQRKTFNSKRKSYWRTIRKLWK